MTREFRLMLAEQGAADPELAGCDVHRPADPRDAEIARLRAALTRVCAWELTPEMYRQLGFRESNPAADFVNARAALAQSGEAEE